MNTEEAKQLDLLSVFHYVVGGLLALFSCLPFLHVFMGIAIITGKFFQNSNGSDAPPDAFGWIFVIMGSVFILMGWIIAICILIAGKKLRARRNRLFCMVVAGFECIFMPFGTVLGVFTLILLSKDRVKEAFESPRQLS
jgi:hypothetical protein